MDGSLVVLCTIAFVIAFLWAIRTVPQKLTNLNY